MKILIGPAAFFIMAVVFNPVYKFQGANKTITIIIWLISSIISGAIFSIREYQYLIPECQTLKVYIPLVAFLIGLALSGSMTIGIITQHIKEEKNKM